MAVVELREALRIEALCGHHTHCQQPPSNVVRMYFSSTLSDLRSERNAFWEKAYPELQGYCQNLGLVFEVVDFRWGMSDCIIVNKMTKELCLQEIQLCQKMSAGPSFIALVGSQYGHHPLPHFIPDHEFELLLRNLHKDQEGLTLIKKWFIKDDNSTCPKYVLQPITTYYPYYHNTTLEARAQHEGNVLSWNLTEARLLQLLRTAALQAEQDGDISAEEKHNYFKSMTEWEMEQGFLKSHQDQDKPSAVIFVRELPNVKKSERHKHVSTFLDVTADGLLDDEAQELLNDFKKRIRSSHSSDLSVQCLELSKAALDVNRKEHKDYLQNFYDQVVSLVKEKINRKDALADTRWLWLQEELFHQAKLSHEKCTVYSGRDDLLSKLCLSMWQSTNIKHGPLVVYGTPGIGKTALLCKLAEEMRAILEPQAVVVLRVLGTSPLSSDVDSLLKGICCQVCGALGLAVPCPQTASSHERLVRFFHAMLLDVSEKAETLLLILDSLDCLSQTSGQTLHWLPKEIPPNVHLIVSALRDGTQLKKLKSLVNDDCFFEMEPLTFDQGHSILEAFINAAGRKLAKEQVDAVLHSFYESRSALHLKLMLDMAKQWSSYTTMSGIHLGSSVDETISLFLQTLEIKHGKKLVCHALGYITLSRCGLSEAELRDILSLDNDVLSEVYQSQLPPNHTLIRFPPLLWARLRHDLGDHLMERWENGIIVFGFSVRQFNEMVKKRYLSAEQRVHLHSLLCEYFLGQWSQGKLKPILLSSLNTQVNADRKVPCQPLRFTEGTANTRMLHELPYHLLHAGKWEELLHSLLGNLDWLSYKTLSCGVASVIQDLSLCADVMNSSEVQLVRDCFLLLKPTVDFVSGQIDLSLLFTEISARLQALAPVYPNLIGHLCSQCHDWFASCPDPVLVPKCNFIQSPGGPLKNTLSSCTKGITAVDLSAEKDLLVAGSVDGELIAWDLKHLEVLHTLAGHAGPVQTVNLLDQGDHCLSTGLDGTLRKWCLLNGKQTFCIPAAVSVQPWPAEQILVLEPSAMVLSNAQGQVKAWHLDTGELLYNIDVKGECSVLCVLEEGVAVMSSDGHLWLHDSFTGIQKSHNQLSSTQGFIVSSVLTLPKHGKVIIASQEKSLLLVSASGPLADVDLPATASFMCASEDETMLFAGCEETLVVLLVNQDSLHRTQDFRHEATVLSAVSYGSGSKIITASQDQVIRVWGLITGQLLDSFDSMGSVTFISVYKSTIISASTRSGCLKLWQLDYDPKHKSKTCIPANCPRVVISTDGNSVHFIHDSRTKVFTWSCSDGLSSESLDVCSEVCCMELAQQKSLLFCGLCTGTVLIYPLAFAQETLCLPPPENLPAVRCISISPREDKVAVAYENTVCLFEITARDNFPCVESTYQSYPLSLLYSTLSAMALVQDCRLLYGTLEGKVAVYNFKSATTAELDNHGSAITCIALSNWDTRALVGSEDCVQKLWSLNPVLLNHIMEYKGFFFEGVQCAAFSVNDKYVFTGSRDKTIKVWDVATGSLLYIQYIYAAVMKIAPYKDGFIAISQLGSFIKEGFHCPSALPPGYNPLRGFGAHYCVISQEKSLESSHSVLKGFNDYNPAQFNFINVMKTKQSNTCLIL